MIIINTIDEQTFSLNGINYTKNFVAIKTGEQSLMIVNLYDTKFKLLETTKYDEIILNGVVHISLINLMNAITSVLFFKKSLKDLPYLGSIVPSSVLPLSAGDAFWTATQAGTYTNFGGFVVPVNSFAIISRVNSVWSISTTALNLNENSILEAFNPFKLGGYSINSIVRDEDKNIFVSKINANTYSLWLSDYWEKLVDGYKNNYTITLVDNIEVGIPATIRVNALNELQTQNQCTAFRNIDVTHFTLYNDIEIEYEGCRRVPVSSSTTAYLVTIDDSGISSASTFLNGVSVKEKVNFIIPKGTKKISVTFFNVSEFGMGLKIIRGVTPTDKVLYELENKMVSLASRIIEDNSGVTSVSASSGFTVSRFIKIDKDKVYITAKNITNGVCLVGYESNESNATGVTLLGAGIYNDYPVDIPKNIKYIRISGYRSRGLSVKTTDFYNELNIDNIPIAHWDFTEESAPFSSKVGDYKLELGSATAPTKISLNKVGGGLRFTGTQYLIINNDKTNRLNIGKYSTGVTVIAWVLKNAVTEQNNFIAGMWREDNNNPSRQYGMFTNLNSYGSRNQVIGHISRYGTASPGINFSRDMSSSGDALEYNKLECIAFTYDGENIISYRNGLADYSLDYNEGTVSGTGQGLIYNKNPYFFPEGLNRESISDFTVGAVRLTAGMSNFFKGDLGEVMVFDKALTGEELMTIHLEKSINDEILRFNFNRNTTVWSIDRDIWRYGWNNFLKDGFVLQNFLTDSTSWGIEKTTSYGKAFATSNSTSFPNMIYKDLISKNILPYSFFKGVSFYLNNTGTSVVKFCLKINNVGWVCSSDFIHTGASTIATSSTEQQFNINFKDYVWYKMNIIPNKTFEITTDVVTFNQSSEIETFGFASVSGASGLIIRITDIVFHRGN